MPGFPSNSIIFLYEFVYDGVVFRLANFPKDIEIDGEMWIPYNIKHSSVNEATDPKKGSLSITLPLDSDVSSIFKPGALDKPMTVTVYQATATWGFDKLVFWKGSVSSYSFKNKTIVLTAQSLLVSLRRTALRARFQKTCRHDLYGTMCKVDKTAYAVNGNVTTKEGLVLTIPEAANQPDGYYRNGIVVMPNNITRTIVDHIGDKITLLKFDKRTDFTALPIAVTLYPGCDKTLSTCKNKFNNTDNNGGFKWIPSKNPMGGNSII